MLCSTTILLSSFQVAIGDTLVHFLVISMGKYWDPLRLRSTLAVMAVYLKTFIFIFTSNEVSNVPGDDVTGPTGKHRVTWPPPFLWHSRTSSSCHCTPSMIFMNIPPEYLSCMWKIFIWEHCHVLRLLIVMVMVWKILSYYYINVGLSQMCLLYADGHVPFLMSTTVMIYCALIVQCLQWSRTRDPGWSRLWWLLPAPRPHAQMCRHLFSSGMVLVYTWSGKNTPSSVWDPAIHSRSPQ